MRITAAFLGMLIALTGLRRLCRWFCPSDEIIAISSPPNGATIHSPVTVSGRGRATQHNQLTIEIRDSSNTVIGSGSAFVSAPLGQHGPYSSSVSFVGGVTGTPGTIQVFDSSPATGALSHLASVLIRFP